MRITNLRATPVAVPYRIEEIWDFGRRRGQISVLLEVETDEGIIGLGEAAAYPSADIVQAVLRSIEPLVLGSDPQEIEKLIRRIDLVGTWHHVKATSPSPPSRWPVGTSWARSVSSRWSSFSAARSATAWSRFTMSRLPHRKTWQSRRAGRQGGILDLLHEGGLQRSPYGHRAGRGATGRRGP